MNKEQTFSEAGLAPSVHLAWILGVLCGGGSLRQGSISISAYETFFPAIFAQRFSTLFDMSPRHYTSQDKAAQKIRHTIAFNSRRLASELGDLKLGVWPTTLPTTHPWIVSKKKYVQSFVNGYFDRNGSISDPQKSDHYQAALHLNDWAAFEYLQTLVRSLGVQDSVPKKPSARSDKIVALSIRGLHRVHALAETVQSVMPAKETLLELFRGFPPAFLVQDENMLVLYTLVMQLHQEKGWGSQRLHQYLASQNQPISVAKLDEWLYNQVNPHQWWKLYPSHTSQASLAGLSDFRDQLQVAEYLKRFKKHHNLNYAYAVIYDAMVHISHTEEMLPVLIEKLQTRYGDTLDWKKINQARQLITDWIPTLRSSETVNQLRENVALFAGVYTRCLDDLVEQG